MSKMLKIISSVKNVKTSKCQKYLNIKMSKCYHVKMLERQNVKIPKCHIVRMSRCQNAKNIKNDQHAKMS